MKVFLITGASTGIGAATARLAVEAGYRVALAARSKDKLDALVKELGGKDKAVAISCDVASFEDQQNMVQETLDAFGQIDAVLANAGTGTTKAGVENGEPDNWRDMIMTNIYGCMITAKVCIPEVKKTRGHILLTGSVAGRRIRVGSIYGATKWAVTGFGYNLFEEMEGTGVRVTLIEPGMVDTPFFDSPKPDALKAEDIGRAVMYAVSQPDTVDVSEILVLPTSANARQR